MPSIYISETKLISSLVEIMAIAGSQDHGVFVTAGGDVEARDKSQDNSLWVEIVSASYLTEFEWEGLYLPHKDYNCQKSAEWIIREADFIDNVIPSFADSDDVDVVIWNTFSI